MHFLLVSVRKDLRRYLGDPLPVAIWFGIPIALGTLMFLLLGGRGGIAVQVHVLVVDEEQSFLSELLTHPEFGRFSSFMDVELVSRERGLTQIEAGQATALLLIPEGFDEAVLSGKETELTLITNPVQAAFSELVHDGIDVLVDTIFYVQEWRAMGGPELDSWLASEHCGDAPASLTTQVGCHLPRIHGPVLASGIFLDSSTGAETDRLSDHLVSLFLPGLLFLSILFIVRGISGDVWQEKQAGTLRRILCSPHSPGLILGAKVLVATTFVAAVSAATLAVDRLFLDLSPERVLLALLWCTFSGAVLMQLFLLIQVLARTQRGANVLSTMVLMPLLMMGGSFIPFEMMPKPMALMGRLTPNGLALSRLKEILAGGSLDVGGLWIAATLMLLFGAGSFLFCYFRVRRGFALAT